MSPSRVHQQRTRGDGGAGGRAEPFTMVVVRITSEDLESLGDNIARLEGETYTEHVCVCACGCTRTHMYTRTGTCTQQHKQIAETRGRKQTTQGEIREDGWNRKGLHFEYGVWIPE